MRIAFDLDNTLCEGTYDFCKPKLGAKKLLELVRSGGHTIIIYTARGMGRSAGNQELARVTMEAVTRKQLDEWEFIYDELYFGKPSFDIAFDDKAFNADDISKIYNVLGIEMPTEEKVLEYRVTQIEKRLEQFDGQLAGHASRTESMLRGIDDKLNAYLQRTALLEVKHEVLDDTLKKIEADDIKKDEAISSLKVSVAEKVVPGGVAGIGGGAIIAAIVEGFKYLHGS